MALQVGKGMTTINNIEDLIRVLDENPEWVEAVRARLLTRELLELPQVVTEIAERIARIEENQAEMARNQAEMASSLAELTSSHAQLAGSLAELTSSHAQLAGSLAELTSSHAQLAGSLAELTSSHAQLAEALARLEARQDRMQDDLGWIIGRTIYDIVRNDAGLIAREMGFELEKTLVRADLMELTRGQNVSDLPRSTLQNFHRADLMMQVVDEADNSSYIAVEASFTVNGRDSRRARRNAELMTRFTGQPAMAAVAGVRYDWELKSPIEFEQLHWYEIPAEDLEAE